MNSFTIKDLENLSGIKAHTIRIWEQRYKFLKPERTVTNIRYYSNEELKKILNIALLNKYGFKISHIDKMNDGEVYERILTLTQIQAQIERIVNELIQCMVDLDTAKFEVILNEYIVSKGIERTILQLIFPFLEKIGILWTTNHVNPAQEHLVSNIIRQKIIAGIEELDISVKGKKTALLFLPQGEYHELGLLFVNYLLKCQNVNVIYAGADISITDIDYIVKSKKPDYLYCHITCVANNFSFERFIMSLNQKFKAIPIIISGNLAHSYQKKIPSNINFKRSLTEVMEFVASI